jgi:ATP-dependent Clp protease ATP-binding subunit ClpC
MSKEEFNILAITQVLENETFLSEALFFPEVSRYGAILDNVHFAVEDHAKYIVENLPLIELYKRRVSANVESLTIDVEINPSRHSIRWKSPITLKFHLVYWNHLNVNIAFIPALGIEVVTNESSNFIETVSQHIKSHILRNKYTTSLGNFVWLQRCQSIRVDQLTITPEILTPKQVAIKRAKPEQKKSILKEIATDLTSINLNEAYEVKDSVTLMAEILTGRNPKSVLLIGPSGVGKTALVHQLVRTRVQYQLGKTPFWSTSGSRLVSGMTGFGMWQERCQQLWIEVSKERAVLHVGNLIELMEVGKSISDNQGIASFLRPYISRGDMLVIAECTPEQLPIIEKEDPHLLDAFYQFKVEEPSIDKGRSILLNAALKEIPKLTRKTYKSSIPRDMPIELDGIETLDRLHRRYATYSAYPGRPLRFLRNVLKDRPQDHTLTPSEIIAAFSRETGLPYSLLDDAIRLDLDHTYQWFNQRVIGQLEATNLIVNLIATIKTMLTRPGKPIASLLFIGPTGVGKTEMAKSLAEFLFNDRNRMIRFDMSEYSDPIAVKRLIGGIWGAEGLMTSKVREQPFTVILLDEFEKAHHSFFDLLLQVLGEGRLTDLFGRVADFCNSVVIMTSNLGAESFQKGSIGFSDEYSDRAYVSRHFINEVRSFIRPELFNRIDCVVPFLPLNEETISSITNRELERLKERDGIRYKGVGIEISNDVSIYLSQRGYHPRYGARPLKRTIEKELLVPLAEALNQSTTKETPPNVDIDLRDGSLQINVTNSEDYSNIGIKDTSAKVCMSGSILRRKVQAIEHSPVMLSFNNEIFRLEQLKEHLEKRRWKSVEDTARLERLPLLQTAIQNVKSINERVIALETKMLTTLYKKQEHNLSSWSDSIKEAEKELDNLALNLYALTFKRSDYVTLVIYGDNTNLIFEMADAYSTSALSFAAEVTIELFRLKRKEELEKEELEEEELQEEENKEEKEGEKKTKRWIRRERLERVEDLMKSSKDRVRGIALGIHGQLSYPRYEAERGKHIFIRREKRQECYVTTTELALEEYKLPTGLERKITFPYEEIRREYNFDKEISTDKVLNKVINWNGQALDRLLTRLIEERIITEVSTMLFKR